MGNKEWDENLKNLLGDFKPEGLQPHWEEFSNQLDNHQDLNETGDDPSFDENLKESFLTYKAPGEAVGWQRIQASLDAADKRFDEDVRKRIADFEPHYDPRTWPLFLQRLSDSKFLGAKLIALKVVEVAAVLLILLTVVNMGRMGKLPFDTPLYDKPVEELKSNSNSNGMADNSFQQTSIGQNKEGISAVDQIAAQTNTLGQKVIQRGTYTSNTRSSKNKSSKVASETNSKTEDVVQSQKSYTYSERAVTENIESIPTIIRIKEPQSNSVIIPANQNLGKTTFDLVEDSGLIATDAYLIASADMDSRDGATDYLTTLTSPVAYNDYAKFLYPTFVKQRKRFHTEFGILSQVDYNRLRMPEDRLYSTGRQIVFPQQGIPSNGYGGGFTLARAHPRWAIESGLIYSAKTFKPGRKLAVGTAFDNGIVEFEAMRLQLVTMPLQLRYKLDHKGPLKFYALAGFGLNLIVQSNIDVLINYHFPSLSAGEDPYKDPNLANTIKETRRVKEHIRDGAPFSTKSFVSATAGLGAEYSINEHKTFFLQTAVQYQIPDLEFSNNNGKHIRSVSIQAGVRTPLGK